MNKTAVNNLMLGTMIFGMAPILVRLSHLPPATIALYRMGIGLAILSLLWLGRKPTIDHRPKPHFISVVAGLLLGADISLWYYSITLTSIAHATFLACSAPFFACLFSHKLLNKKIKSTTWCALFLTLLGMALLTLQPQNKFEFSYLGDLIAITCAIIYAGYLLLVNELAKHSSPTNIHWTTTMYACIPLIIGSMLETGMKMPNTYNEWRYAIMQGIIIQVLSQSLIIRGLAKSESPLASVIILLQPVAAVTIAAFLFHEWLTISQMIGAAAILTGVYIATSLDSDHSDDHLSTHKT